MRAVRVENFGEPSEELRQGEVSRPALGDDEVLVEVRAAAINPSDAKNVQGAMSHLTTLPRIPGRDFAGVVVEGPKELVETEVWGTGGDLGFTRDGTHAQYLAVPRAAVRAKPGSLSFEEAAAVGVGYLTAYLALVERGGLSAGETVMVTGAVGAVGSAAVQIARWKGAALVIGAVREAWQRATAEQVGADAAVETSQEDWPEMVKEATDGRGADLAFDTVGGPLFEPSLAALAVGGRLVVITSAEDRRVSFDLLDFYHNELQLLGLDTLKVDAERAARVLDELAPGFEEGALSAPSIAERYPLEEAATAYTRVLSGEADGKVVLVRG